MTPPVTVLMSVYDGEAFLREAIDSVLGQTHRDLELLIVDDGSNAATRRILATYTDPRITILRNEENIGLTRSLNRGLAHAGGVFVVRQDADDRSHRDRITRQLAFLEAHPEVAVVGSRARIIDEYGNVRRGIREYRATTPLAIEWQLLFGNPFIHSSVMFRRSIVVEELGGYDESYLFNQDFELWSRLLAKHAGRNLPEPLLDSRAHAGSIVGVRGMDVIASRRANVERNKSVQRRNVARILRHERLAAEWPEVWTRVNVSWLTGPPERPGRVLELIDEIRARFAELHPESRDDGEVRRSLAAILAVTARHLVQVDRVVAARALFRAAAADAAIAASAAPHLAALAVGGDRLRAFANRIRGRKTA